MQPARLAGNGLPRDSHAPIFFPDRWSGRDSTEVWIIGLERAECLDPSTAAGLGYSGDPGDGGVSVNWDRPPEDPARSGRSGGHERQRSEGEPRHERQDCGKRQKRDVVTRSARGRGPQEQDGKHR